MSREARIARALAQREAGSAMGQLPQYSHPQDVQLPERWRPPHQKRLEEIVDEAELVRARIQLAREIYELLKQVRQIAKLCSEPLQAKGAEGSAEAGLGGSAAGQTFIPEPITDADIQRFVEDALKGIAGLSDVGALEEWNTWREMVLTNHSSYLANEILQEADRQRGTQR